MSISTRGFGDQCISTRGFGCPSGTPLTVKITDFINQTRIRFIGQTGIDFVNETGDRRIS